LLKKKSILKNPLLNKNYNIENINSNKYGYRKYHFSKRIIKLKKYLNFTNYLARSKSTHLSKVI